MDFVFQGFQTNFPLWAYILLAAGTGILAWWSYKDLETVRPVYRYLLIGLRTSVFFILLILLLNPFFRHNDTFTEKPVISVYLDNSASTSIQKGAFEGISTYREVLEKLNFTDFSEARFEFFSVGGTVDRYHPDSLSLDGSHTNLFNVIEHVRNRSDDIRGSVVISDGIFNQGRNPVFEAGNLETPVFTIALGDTSRPRDLIVQDVVTNTAGYLGTSHPVEVTVRSNGFSGIPFDVRLQRENNVLESRTITMSEDQAARTIEFELEPQEQGLHQYQIVIPALQGEWSSENNSQPFSVNILDDKQHILSVAFGIHPDVKTVRSILLQDQNVELSQRTWVGGNRFIENPFNVSADSLDLLVVQGFPSSGVPSAVTETLAVLVDEVPALFMALPGYSPQTLASRTDIVLPVSRQSSGYYVETAPVSAVSPTAHPVMELPEIDFQALPPLMAPVNGLQAAPGSTVLFRSSHRGSDTGAPMVVTRELGNMRRAEITGYGWYRIRLSSNPDERRFVEEVIANLAGWTATRPDKRRLKISPTQEVYTGNESIVFNAFLTNESGENEPDATIDLTLEGDNIKDRFYTLENLGSGQYTLEIGSFPRGVYQYRATAEKGERVIDEQSGEFSVSSSNVEYINTRRNDRLLRQIAERSGGSAFLYTNIDGFRDSLQTQKILEPVWVTESNYYYPYKYFYWFIAVLALLSLEWILRKYLSLP